MGLYVKATQILSPPISHWGLLYTLLRSPDKSIFSISLFYASTILIRLPSINRYSFDLRLMNFTQNIFFLVLAEEDSSCHFLVNSNCLYTVCAIRIWVPLCIRTWRTILVHLCKYIVFFQFLPASSILQQKLRDVKTKIW
jgi:hypothetical protein